MKRLLAILLLIGCTLAARAQSIDNVTNGDVRLFGGASYATEGHEWYASFMSYFPSMHPDKTNDLPNVSRSGESWGGFYGFEEEKWGLPLWSVHTNLKAQCRMYYPSDDNGGYGTTNALYTNGLLLATAPQSFFNGTAATNEGYNFPIQFDFIGNPYTDNGAGDGQAIARNLGSMMLQTNFGRLPVDMWHTLATNGWTADQTGARLLGFSTGSHPYQGGFEAANIVAYTALGADTNVGSVIIDYNALTAITNHFTVSGITNTGTAIQMTIAATRMPPGWVEVPGQGTNQGSMAFRACPVLANWFQWVLRGTNFPSSANCLIKLDGQAIGQMTGAQFNGGWNMFTNMSGAWWNQRCAVVNALLDEDGVDHTNLLNTHNAGSGGLLGEDNINYESHASLYYDTEGQRGSTYVASIAPEVASLEKYDAAIYAAAQQTNHTLSIQFVQTVDTNSDLTVPSSELWAGYIPTAPADGSTQYINPPVFTWMYAENAATNASSAPRFYEFQLTTNAAADYTAPYWDVSCSNNFYNFLPPITNANGSSWLGTNYWRIKYLSTNGSTVIATSTNHWFMLASAATNWNRAMLADTNYLLGFATNHPHLWFHADNIAPLGNFLRTNVWPVSSLATISNAAAGYQLDSWWASPSLAATNLLGVNVAVGAVQEVAFMYLQSQSNAFWDVNGAGVTLSNICVAWTNNNFDLQDWVPTVEVGGPSGVAYSYDWLYPFLTAGERTIASDIITRNALFSAYDDNWYWTMSPAITNNAQGYTNALTAVWFNAGKGGVSHERWCAPVGLVSCLANMGESPTTLGLYNLFQNYALAQFDPYQGDEGRGYGEQANFKYDRMFGPPCAAMVTFTNAQLWRAPVLTNIACFFAAMEPVGFRSVFGSWGDLNFGFRSQWFQPRYYDLALVTGNGAILRKYNRAQNYITSAKDLFPLMGEAFLPYYFPLPTETDWPTTTYFDPNRHGYLAMGSLPPTDFGAFTNGFNVWTVARPGGSRDEHANFSDGDVEITYHGSQVTAVGVAGYYDKNPLYHNGVFVRGIGTVNPLPESDPLMGHFILHTNLGDTTVYGMDITAAMSRTNNVSTGGGSGGNFIQYYTYASNTVPDVTAIREYGFDMHNRYYLRFISCQTSSNEFFQTAWHIAEPTYTVNTNLLSLTYTCTNIYDTNPASSITVYMQEANNPTEEGLLVEGGTNNWKLNPFTGENNMGVDQDTGPFGNCVLWFTNKVATTNFTFFQSAYPANPGQAAPTITRWSDRTLEINDGTYDDVVSIDETNASPPSTLVLLTGSAAQNQGGGGVGGSGGSSGVIRVINLRAVNTYVGH